MPRAERRLVRPRVNRWNRSAATWSPARSASVAKVAYLVLFGVIDLLALWEIFVATPLPVVTLALAVLLVYVGLAPGRHPAGRAFYEILRRHADVRRRATAIRYLTVNHLSLGLVPATLPHAGYRHPGAS